MNPQLDDDTQRLVLARVEGALRAADVAGTTPTPLEAVVQHAGIAEVVDVAELPSEVYKLRPRALRRVLGAIFFPARTVFVDSEDGIEARRRWILAHETVHKLLPWHEQTALLDDERRLFRGTEEQRELEANLGAGHLLFQGHRFLERVRDERCSIATPIAVADEYETSLTATLRYFTDTHPEPVALLMTGRLVWANGRVPIYVATESNSFRHRFGPIIKQFPGTGLPAIDGLGYDALADALRHAGLPAGEYATEMKLQDRDGGGVRMSVEAFSNNRNWFIMFTPRRRLSLGRRTHVVRRGARDWTATPF